MNIAHLLDEYVLILRLKLMHYRQKFHPSEWSSGHKRHILLIQGFNEPWTFLGSIGNQLNLVGHTVHYVLALGMNRLPITQGVEIVKQYILDTNLQDFVVIGHSKGGILGTYLLLDNQIHQRIYKVITVATPFGGTIFGKFFKPVAELSPNSRILMELYKPEVLAKTVNIYPKFDNHVLPNKYLLLPGGNNILIPIIGHTRILRSKLTFEIIEKEVD